MKKIKVGVIGVGSLGQHHARVFAELAGSLSGGVADVDRAGEFGSAGWQGCRAGTDYRELLPDVEAVSVVTPTLLHHVIARACLAAGRHVLVEKPLAATVAEARDLVAAAADRGVTLQVGHIERFNAAFRATRGAIKEPTLIECRRWAPFTPRGADVDVGLDLMVHDLDLVLGLISAPVREIQASGVSILSATTDVAQARVVFQNGCLDTFSANRVAESKLREVRILQPEGYVVIDLAQQTASVGRRTMGTSGRYEVLTEQVRGDGREPLKLELEAFLDAVRNGAQPLVSGREGAAALELAYAIINAIGTHSHHHG